MRSRHTQELARRALVRLAGAVGDHVSDFCVIGGLNADLLTEPHDPPHQGTIDVDLLIEVGLVFDRDDLDFGWLERALTDVGFEADPSGRSWVWWLRVDGAPVRLDVLCDTPDNPGQEIALPGAPTVAAQNVAGPAPALKDVVLREFALDEHTRSMVKIPFAGLGGYTLAKAAAAHHRGEPRDFYDLVYVLIYNTDGAPEAVARAAVAALPPRPHTDHLALLRATLTALTDPDGTAARAYASQRVHDGDSTAEAVLAQDAATAALACRDELDRLRPPVVQRAPASTSQRHTSPD